MMHAQRNVSATGTASFGAHPVLVSALVPTGSGRGHLVPHPVLISALVPTG